MRKMWGEERRMRGEGRGVGGGGRKRLLASHRLVRSPSLRYISPLSASRIHPAMRRACSTIYIYVSHE